MSEVADSGADAGRPDPAAANTPAEFVEALRRLKRWSGLGYRQLEKRGAAIGESLPRSTLTAALTRDTLPREDLVVALVRTCANTAWTNTAHTRVGVEDREVDGHGYSRST